MNEAKPAGKFELLTLEQLIMPPKNERGKLAALAGCDSLSEVNRPQKFDRSMPVSEASGPESEEHFCWTVPLS
ncbi:unnamed protein product [Penicillium bialowiezense]